jgi:hypothetical protein
MKHRHLILALIAIAALLTTCESPMGMGPPVDTTAPSVFIHTPADNEFIRGILLGSPVIMTGSWIDDFGLKSLMFEVYNKTAGIAVTPDGLTYKLDADGKWRAELTITPPGSGADDYNIKVYAVDGFDNVGMAEVNVRLDIIPPWIQSAYIVRHPKSGFNFSSELFPRADYEADGYQLAEAYRNIPYTKIDQYQNETFTLRVEIKPSYAEVAASRLFVKDENDAYLHTEELVPAAYWQEGEGALRYPEWEITASQLERWRSSFSGRANYIFFEVWAWSEAAWDKENNQPYPGEPGRVQKIEGTVYYPQSDYPHVYVNHETFVNNVIVLEPNMPDALAVEFYDDDRLGTIYARLLTKQAFDALAGGDEEAYLNVLTDPSDVSGKRAALISALSLTNMFVPSSGEDRFRRVNLSTTGLGTGEYRLIALAKDDKSKTGYSFESGAVERWGVYPPVKIQIHNADAPFIFVENPERENVFPHLSSGGGNSFIMSGYTLGRMETASLAIAWVPKALQANGLQNGKTVLESPEVTALNPGQTYTAAGIHAGITVWKLAPQQAAEKTVLNDVQYFRADFSKSFHIITDFQYEGVLENDDKLFVILAANASTSTFQTFNLPGLLTGPEVEVTSHRRGAGHDPAEDLVLRMTVNAGSYGVLVQTNSQIITETNGLTDDDAGFTGATAFNGNEWTRTIPSSYIQSEYNEGDTRTYVFRARDILGNLTEHTREIIMTDQPLLQSITCTEEAGTYGIGTTLRFEAAFSMPVRVTYEIGSAPRLKLYLVNPGNNTSVNTNIWADYDTNTPIGNTLFFTYTVQEGHTTNLLCTSLDAITLNGALITSYGYKDADIVLSDQNGSLQNNKAIKLDGDRPLITRASFAPLAGYNYSGISYFNNGKTITLKLITNESVKIAGTPQAVIRYGASPIQLKAQYASRSSSNGIDTLYFTHTVNDTVAGVSNIIDLTRLEWGDPWFDLANGAITDMAGNAIISGGYGSLPAVDRNGSPSEQGYIKTTIPPTPQYSFINPNEEYYYPGDNYASGRPGDPGKYIGKPDMNAAHVLINKDITLRITGGLTPSSGIGGATLYYSLEGGNNPQTVTGNTGTGDVLITDKNAANKYSSSYERSRYNVTAWQEDLAGNRSAQATARQVTINSRWPELVSVEVALPDGTYPNGTKTTFRLNFSEKVRILKNYGPTWVIGLRRGANGATVEPTSSGGVVNSGPPQYFDPDGEYSSSVLIDWWSAINGTAKDVKANFITFQKSNSYFGLVDEYGNVIRDYSGTAAESDTNPNRPIASNSTFQINRPNLEFNGDQPKVIAASPQLPAASGVNYNGGVLAANSRTFTLTFDVPVTKVHGTYITVRPYGEWAIPPILSVEEMNALLNHPAVVNGRFSPGGNIWIGYKEVLTDVDDNGVPNKHTLSGDYYNFYTKTTHGLKDIGGYVRPDTATKWVLNYDIDPYVTYPPDWNLGNNDPSVRLREVFNAAGWKQQRIHVGSAQVTVSGAVVTVTLNEALLPGRIWEVVWDEGAFQNAAGNGSTAYPPWSGHLVEGGYRFWSAGTAAPVVRVNRVSHDNRYSGGFDPPNIDTEVRIDCETPGATIRYDVIGTRFLPAAANSSTTVYVDDWGYNYSINNIFVSTVSTDASFFGSNLPIRTAATNPPHVVAEFSTSPYTGYLRNTIGNDDFSTAKDANGFYNTLLVPNTVRLSMGGYGGQLTNGAPLMTQLNNLGNAIRNRLIGNANSCELYREVSASGAASYGAYVKDNLSGVPGDKSHYFYVGEAYRTLVKDPDWSNGKNGETDPRLYSGRRDYVAAAARKNEVSDTTTDDGKRFAGPLLSVSTAAGYEGVYKTTVIYRNPISNNGVTSMFIFGHDLPLDIGVSGFPFKGTIFSSVPEGGQQIFEGPYYKTAYRIGTLPTTDTTTVSITHVSNNHIWNTWEIVTDWFQSASFYSYGSQNGPWVNYLFNTKKDSLAIGGAGIGDVINGGWLGRVTATYGGVTYRYRQTSN